MEQLHYFFRPGNRRYVITDHPDATDNGIPPGTNIIGEVWPQSSGNDHEAIVQRIVRACNSHDSLVEACEEMLTCLDAITSAEFASGADHNARQKLDAALADARKGE